MQYKVLEDYNLCKNLFLNHNSIKKPEDVLWPHLCLLSQRLHTWTEDRTKRLSLMDRVAYCEQTMIALSVSPQEAQQMK